MATSQASANFLKSLKSTAAKDWNKSRTARDPFAPLDVPDGNYVGQLVSIKLGNDKKQGSPYVNITIVITEPKEHAGQQARKMHLIRASQKQSIADKLDRMFTDIQVFGIYTDKMDMNDLPDVAEKLTKDKPFVKLSISTGDQGGQFINLNGLADDDVDYVTESGDEQAADTDGDDTTTTAVPPDDAEWSQGDECDFKPPRSRNLQPCTIISSDKDKQTVTLKGDENNKTYEDVPWDKLLAPSDE